MTSQTALQETPRFAQQPDGLCTRALSPEQIAQYHEDGFVVVPRFFDLEEIKPLDEACRADPTLKNAQTKVVWDDGTSCNFMCYTGLGNSMLGVMPRMARMVTNAETLLGQECYHYHSKIVRKLPNEGTVHWHQDYTAWYEDGCLYPDLVSCAVAIDPNTKENGCLKFVKKSHLLGRLENVADGNSVRANPAIIEKILEKLEVVYCELEPGDAVFFHSKTLHAGGYNHSTDARTLFYSTYNIVSNEPWCLDGQKHHRYRPLAKLSDSVLKERNYTSVLFADDELPPVETDDSRRNICVRSK
ncbi:MAG: phytanoyl-CoA dioxygenase family protein [Xenococcaceae cyanobacterium MO_234.B1]|nr:phytanoyl-CoA dioxygenase family protein [Xenococcaceae cyanobacterium MO_234.B1]